jgi:hypothetical protein
MKQKSITKTYRNGKAVFQMEYVIRLKPNVAKTEFHVTEQRAQFKDEKIIFWGTEKKAEEFYANTVSVTL